MNMQNNDNPSIIPVTDLRVGDIIHEERKALNMGTMEYFHQNRNYEVAAIEAIPLGPDPITGTDYGVDGTKVTFVRGGARFYRGHKTVEVSR